MTKREFTCAAAVVPNKCYLAGAGIESPQKCGQPTEFLIVAANADGEFLAEAVAEPFMVEIHPDCSYTVSMPLSRFCLSICVCFCVRF